MRPFLIAVLLSVPGPAFAHSGADGTSSLLAGLAHPLGGTDHLLAMVTVGLWAALSGGRALWLWPATFVSAMLAGGGLGMSGVPLPFVEPAILASSVVLGALVACAVRASAGIGAALIAAFGLVHGHAHGAEIPDLALPAAYVLGFSLATGLLHAGGLALGWAALQARMPIAVRAAGALASLAGASLAFT